jgi:hypothetical protein
VNRTGFTARGHAGGVEKFAVSADCAEIRKALVDGSILRAERHVDDKRLPPFTEEFDWTRGIPNGIDRRHNEALEILAGDVSHIYHEAVLLLQTVDAH